MSNKTITADMTIAEALRANPATEKVFASFGMHCIYCPMSSGESITQAAATHGVDADEMLAKLNEAE